jgi:mRNA-degrading endonuclease toxin of MazEF toxin-antitoxin module
VVSPRPGEVYLAPIKVMRTGEDVPHPALVISTEKFSNRTELVRVVGMTTTPEGSWDLIKPVMAKGKLLDGSSMIAPDLVYTVRTARLRNKLGEVDSETLEKVLAAVNASMP